MLYTIGDLHLSLGTDKPMDIFAGWDNHVERLKENWNSKITDDDTVVLLGDHSWAMKLEDAAADLKFINSELKGRKILTKGNHDLWWQTMNKINVFAKENGFTTLSFLFNNAFLAEGLSICGTRGWISENGEPADAKVLAREAGRLEMSLQAGVKLGGELTAFIHYPPVYRGEVNNPIVDVLNKYGVKRCFYAHLHGGAIRGAVEGMYGGIEYKLVSADSLKFNPIAVNPYTAK